MPRIEPPPLAWQWSVRPRSWTRFLNAPPFEAGHDSAMAIIRGTACRVSLSVGAKNLRVTAASCICVSGAPPLAVGAGGAASVSR